jgi:hypothetical protein
MLGNIKNVVEKHKEFIMAIEKSGLTEQTFLLAEVVIKVVAMERLLIKAGIFTSENLNKEMKLISDEVTKFIAAGQFDLIKSDLNKN